MFRVSLVFTFLAVVGCNAYTGSTEGENGLFSFYEPNDYPDDGALSSQGFKLPIATGARVDVWTTSPGVSSFESAVIDDSSVLSIESQVYPIIMRARAEGSARLRVTQSDGAEDTLQLSVVDADDARVWILPEQGLFGDVTASSTGLALRPGARVRVAGQPKSGTTPLLGFDVFEWSMDASLFTQTEDGALVNTLRLEATGGSGVTTISTQLGGSLELAALSAQDPLDLTLLSLAQNQNNPLPVTALVSEDLPLFFLSAADSAGRAVKASSQDDRDFAAVVTSGTLTILEAKIGNRAASLRACAGSGTIELSYLGSKLSVPIEVSADAADPECP